MYAKLSRGPSKFVASTRRGPPKQLDNLENKDADQSGENNFTMNSPRPVFNHHLANGRHHGYHNRPRSASQDMSAINPQHEELVRFVSEAFNKVEQEFRASVQNQREGGPLVYKEKKQTQVANFKPFDLAEYWGKRTMEKLTGSS